MPLYLKTVVVDDSPGRYVQASAAPCSVLFCLIREAIVLAKKLECGIEFAFNTYTVRVLPNDDPVERFISLCQQWRLHTPDEIQAWLKICGAATDSLS